MMPTYKAELSSGSLDTLLRELKAYQRKIEAAPAKICDALLDTGKEAIDEVVDGILDPIGNVPGVISADRQYSAGAAKANLNYSGSQVAYIEYGVGVVGQSKPHPKAGEAGWKYNVGKKIRPSGYWSYKDKMKGKWRSTRGIPAQMPVLKASLAMRRKIVSAAKEALK